MKFFLVLFIAFIISCSNKSHVNLKLSDEVIIPKTYIVNKSKIKIIIDGNDNEWDNSLFTSNFIDIEGSKIPSQQTNVKMLWDDKNLYVFARLYEKIFGLTLKIRDEVIYYNNDFEVFINPNDHVFSYGEIEINALGTEWICFWINHIDLEVKLIQVGIFKD